MTDNQNVFSGPNSLIDYFNPDKNPPLPLVELPKELNPFWEDGVRIYAKMLTALPATNVKSLPALSLLESGGVISLDSTPTQRAAQNVHTITESSSGSTVTSMAMIARQHGIPKVRAWMSNKVSPTKSLLMRFFGLELALFGGPSQSPPQDPTGGIAKAAQQAARSPNGQIYNPNQYENHANPQAHHRWTGKQLLDQLPNINVFSAGMGTGGTITGTGSRLKQHDQDIKVVGVCVAKGDKIPGPRPKELLEPVVDFRWRDVVDQVQDVCSKDAYTLSMELCRFGLVCGPSSGLSLQGLYQYLNHQKQTSPHGNLDHLKKSSSTNTGEGTEQEGILNCVFLCCDLPFQYLEEYFEKCDQDLFPPIVNQHLFEVDQYKYSTSWILNPDEALQILSKTRMQKDVNDLKKIKDLSILPPSGHSTDSAGEEEGDESEYQGSDSGYNSVGSSNHHSTPLSSSPQSDHLAPATGDEVDEERVVIVDLRSSTDFDQSSVAQGTSKVNIPLYSLSRDQVSPYDDAILLKTQWTELQQRFSPQQSQDRSAPNYVQQLLSQTKAKDTTTVLLLDHTGDTAKLGTTVLRHHGIQAFSVLGGYQALCSQ